MEISINAKLPNDSHYVSLNKQHFTNNEGSGASTLAITAFPAFETARGAPLPRAGAPAGTAAARPRCERGPAAPPAPARPQATLPDRGPPANRGLAGPTGRRPSRRARRRLVGDARHPRRGPELGRLQEAPRERRAGGEPGGRGELRGPGGTGAGPGRRGRASPTRCHGDRGHTWLSGQHGAPARPEGRPGGCASRRWPPRRKCFCRHFLPGAARAAERPLGSPRPGRERCPPRAGGSARQDGEATLQGPQHHQPLPRQHQPRYVRAGPGLAWPCRALPCRTGPVLTLCCLRRSRGGRGRKQHAGPGNHPTPQHVPAEGAEVSAAWPAGGGDPAWPPVPVPWGAGGSVRPPGRRRWVVSRGPGPRPAQQ